MMKVVLEMTKEFRSPSLWRNRDNIRFANSRRGVLFSGSPNAPPEGKNFNGTQRKAPVLHHGNAHNTKAATNQQSASGSLPRNSVAERGE
jgi:hypothetical protein